MNHPGAPRWHLVHLTTPRLRLVAFDAELARLDAARLAAALDARVPPAAVDEDLWAASAERLAAAPHEAGWLFWLVVERGAVVGTAGFKGPPDADGAVELGYGLVPGARGRGLATEAVGALLAWAFADSRVRTVVAHTEARNEASVRVLAKLGFHLASPEGAILRFERSR